MPLPSNATKDPLSFAFSSGEGNDTLHIVQLPDAVCLLQSNQVDSMPLKKLTG